MARGPQLDPEDLGNTLREIRDRLIEIEIRLDSLEASVETFSTIDLDQALDDVRVEVQSIKDEML